MALTPTEILLRTGPPTQGSETTRFGLNPSAPEDVLDAPWLAATSCEMPTRATVATTDDVAPTESVLDLPSTLQQWASAPARRFTSVEARVIRTAPDEEFDLRLIRDDDVLPQ
jgi:hypothetical protein